MNFPVRLLLCVIFLIFPSLCTAESFDEFKERYKLERYLAISVLRHEAAFKLAVRMRQNLVNHIGKTNEDKLKMCLNNEPGIALTDDELEERAEYLTGILEQLAPAWGFEAPPLPSNLS